MKRKLWILIGMIMIFAVLLAVPSYAACAEHTPCAGCGECLICSACVCPQPDAVEVEKSVPVDYMSLYELWYAIASHWFDGVPCVQAISLFSVIATLWTCIGFAMIPLRFIRGGRR